MAFFNDTQLSHNRVFASVDRDKLNFYILTKWENFTVVFFSVFFIGYSYHSTNKGGRSIENLGL